MAMIIKILARAFPLDAPEAQRVGQISRIAIRKVEICRFDGCKFIHRLAALGRSIFPRIWEFPIRILRSDIPLRNYKRTIGAIYFGVIRITASRGIQRL